MVTFLLVSQVRFATINSGRRRCYLLVDTKYCYRRSGIIKNMLRALETLIRGVRGSGGCGFRGGVKSEGTREKNIILFSVTSPAVFCARFLEVG